MTGDWWVAWTQSQYERRLATDLVAAGVDCYVPMAWRWTEPKGDAPRRRLFGPLFPGYVFVNGDAGAAYEARRSRATLRVICVPRGGQPTLATELADIERSLAADAKMAVYRDLVVGHRVRVMAGPMQGVEGTLIVRDGRKQTFVLRLSVMNGAAELHVDPELLERIE